MTLKERMATIERERMLIREQHGRARARLRDILELLDRESDYACRELVNTIADLARAGLKED